MLRTGFALHAAAEVTVKPVIKLDGQPLACVEVLHFIQQDFISDSGGRNQLSLLWSKNTK